MAASDGTAVLKAAEKATVDAISPEVVKDLMGQVEKSAALDKDAKDKILGLYRQSLQDVEMVAAWEARTAEYAAMAEAAEAERTAAKQEFAALPKEPTLDLPDEASVADEEQLLERYQRQLKVATTALAKAEAEPGRRTIRRPEVQRLLKTARERLAEYRRQPGHALTKTGVEPLELARRIRTHAGRTLMERMVTAYEQELAAFDATSDLLPLRVDLAARKVQLANKAVKILKARVSSARRAEAEQQVRAARLEAALAHPAVQDVATANETLAKDRRDLMSRVEKESKSLARVEETIKSLEKEIASVKDKIEGIGHTGAVGLLLRNQRAALPDMYEHERAVRLRRGDIPEVQLELFKLAERRAKLADIEGQTEAVLNGLPEEALEADGELALTVRELLQTQKQYVDLLTDEYNKYFKILVDLDGRQRELIATSDEYQDYIDEHVLWITSALKLWDAEGWYLSVAGRWLVSPHAWVDVLRSLGRDAVASPLTWLAAILGFVLLVYLRRRWRRSIVLLGDQAAASGVRAFAPTAQAAVLTVMIAAIPFSVPLFLVWRIYGEPPEPRIRADSGERPVDDRRGLLSLGTVPARLPRGRPRRETLRMARHRRAATGPLRPASDRRDNAAPLPCRRLQRTTRHPVARYAGKALLRRRVGRRRVRHVPAHPPRRGNCTAPFSRRILTADSHGFFTSGTSWGLWLHSAWRSCPSLATITLRGSSRSGGWRRSICSPVCSFSARFSCVGY